MPSRDVLRIHCRAVDTAARTARRICLVLPESGEEEAHRVADRIRELWLTTMNRRALRSIGISVYRGDGERIETLLSEADKHLYAEKTKRQSATLPRLIPRVRPKSELLELLARLLESPVGAQGACCSAGTVSHCTPLDGLLCNQREARFPGAPSSNRPLRTHPRPGRV